MTTIGKALRSLQPSAAFVVVGNVYSGIEWLSPEIPMPSEQEVAAEIARLDQQKPFDDCKAKAKKLIAETDWAVLPDVGLQNKSEFEAYRAQLRALIVSPVADPVWPTEPEPIWT